MYKDSHKIILYKDSHKIVSYMGFSVRKKKIGNDAVRCICVVE